ncbi:MAG: hypothetical protein AAGG69_07740 [Pseudomonadota bacterium]
MFIVSACTSTSSIDTTLGSVSQPRETAPLPAPAEPVFGSNDQENEASFPAAPLVDPQPTVQTAETNPAADEPDDLVPQLTIRNTGTYPNLNDGREPTLEQFTDAERAQLTAFMEGLRAEHQSGTISTAEFQRRLRFLQNLERTHSRDALRRIGAL